MSKGGIMPAETFVSAVQDRPQQSDAFVGARHPLAPAEPDAVQVLPGNQTKPIEKLPSGDHTIQFKDGREFLVHVPPGAENKTLPVMFVISGSAQPQWNIKDFATESGMSKFADDPQHSFIAVYPLPKKHFLGRYSKEQAWAWNAEGSLIDKKDLKFAGYDDMAYVKSIANMIPKLANVDPTHKDWGAIGWSQGGPFLNALISKEPNLFPSIGLVGSTMGYYYPYEKREGNAQNVVIVDLLNDKITMPIHGNWEYHKRSIARGFLRTFGRTDIVQQSTPLGAIDNVNQDPKVQEMFYKHTHFPVWRSYSYDWYHLNTPAKSSTKDYVKEYRGSSPDGAGRALTVFSLVEAKHSYPGPIRDGARTNAQEKYLEFDASGEFVKLFNSYNDRVHAAKKK